MMHRRSLLKGTLIGGTVVAFGGCAAVTSAATILLSSTPVDPGNSLGAACTSAGVEYDGDVARTLLAVAVALGHGPADVITRALFAAALVESNMSNPDYGDRDSLGVLQQRPSAGWGTPEQVMDPAYAATAFILGSTLAGSKAGGGNPGARQRLAGDPQLASNPGRLAQRVQISAYPDRYAQRLAEADQIIAALVEADAVGDVVPCDPAGPDQPGNTPGGYVMPAQGRFSSGFGRRWGRMHYGVDIANSVGTPIVAAKAGVVAFAGQASGYGNVVYLDHADGEQTRYAHASRLHVRTGQRVAAGQRIADMGSTGRSTGPHLHFEIRRGGIAIDPAPLLGLTRS